jgi:hypothetical protein
MAEHGVPINRVINGGGIPQRNPVLNQVYANVLNKPVVVPSAEVTSLGSAIFAFLAAGAFPTVEAAQQALCPPFTTIEPNADEARTSEELYQHWKSLYFELGQPTQGARAGSHRRAPPARWALNRSVNRRADHCPARSTQFLDSLKKSAPGTTSQLYDAMHAARGNARVRDGRFVVTGCRCPLKPTIDFPCR